MSIKNKLENILAKTIVPIITTTMILAGSAIAQDKPIQKQKYDRDWLMQQKNTVIIPGRVLAADPVYKIVPGYNHLMELESGNPSYIEVMSSDELTALLKKNAFMERPDNRLLEQVKKTGYDKILTSDVKDSLQKYVDDQIISADETMKIAKLLKSHGKDNLMIGMINRHDGGFVNGKYHKGEAVPYFAVFFSEMLEDEVIREIIEKEYIPYTTSNSRRQPPANIPELYKISSGFGGSYDKDAELFLPEMYLGYHFSDNVEMDVYGSYVESEEKKPNIEFPGPVGLTVLSNVHEDFKRWYLGMDILAGIRDFKVGAGGQFNNLTKNGGATVDEYLYTYYGTEHRGPTYISDPESVKKYWSLGPIIKAGWDQLEAAAYSRYAKGFSPEYGARIGLRF